MKFYNTCRILIDTKCNLDCHYCCNKIATVQEGIKFSTLKQIIEKDYSVYCISGGEPFLNVRRLSEILQEIIRNTDRDPEIYVYTNGTIPTSEIVLATIAQYIVGFSIGYHGEKHDTVVANYMKMRALKPTRVLVNDELYHQNKKQFDFIDKNDLRLWKMNECDKSEDRYII